MRSLLVALALGSALAGPWATTAFAQDDADACHKVSADPSDPGRLADAVRFGALDPAAGIAICESAVGAHPGDARLRSGLARLYAKAGRGADAKAAFLRAAEAGFAPAWVGLGDMFQYGDGGIPADKPAAVEAYRKAYEAGNVAAMGGLAYAFINGDGVEKDVAKGVAFYGEAAAAGDEYAQRELGWMYMSGTNVARDDVEALRHIRPAAARNLPLAQNDLGIMTLEGRGGLKADPVEAVRLFRLAFDQDSQPGSGWAAINLGRLYAEGRGVAADPAEGERLLRYAVDSTEPAVVGSAQNILAYRLAVEGRQLDEAEALARAALAASGVAGEDLTARLDTLAWTLHRQDKHAEALTFALEAVDQPFKEPVNFDHLGDIHAALGRREEARAAWTKALSTPPGSGPFTEPLDFDAVRRKLAE